MDTEILAYIGAALMVILAWLAYRYWHTTPTYARRMRESFSGQMMRPLLAPTPRDDAPVDVELHSDETSTELPPIDQPLEVSDFVADETQEAPSGVDDLLPSESIGDVSEPDTDPVGIEQQAGMVEEREPSPAAPTEDIPVEIMPESLTIAESQPVEAAGSADEGVATIIDGAAESLPPDVQEAATPGDLDPTQPGQDSTRPETETTSDQDTEPAPPEEDTAQPEVETSDESSAGASPETAAASQMEGGETSEEIPMKPEYRLIEELEPRNTSSPAITETGSVAALLKEIDKKLAALPSGIGLIDLPILERRRIADRREELLSDRELLLEQKRRGAHRRRRSSPTKG